MSHEAELTIVSLPDEMLLLVIRACNCPIRVSNGLPLFEDVKGLWRASPRACTSSSTGCSLSWEYRASPSCSAPLEAQLKIAHKNTRPQPEKHNVQHV